jgi:hypothetical protein
MNMALIQPVKDSDVLDAERRHAYEEEIERAGMLTNMKGTTLLSLAVHQAYASSYLIKEELVKLLGKRAFAVYAHAISNSSGCLLCSTYFRRELRNLKVDPKDFEPTPREQILMELGLAIGGRKMNLNSDLWGSLKAEFSEQDIVNLVGFGGKMVATNIFNSILEVDLDPYLTV